MTAASHPDFTEWVPLDRAHVRTTYLEAKAARLVLGERVTWLPEPEAPSELAELLGVEVPEPGCYRFRVEGDHKPYECWAKVVDDPQQGETHRTFWATCSRGGDHDYTLVGAACSHMLAAAVELARTVRPELGHLVEEQDMSDEDKPGLAEDRSEIKLVPEGQRAVWGPTSTGLGWDQEAADEANRRAAERHAESSAEGRS